ncbi:MAG TPA: type I asparaginase [Candidatus Avibacteroides excrementipullorum]|jgi:L-asparaginase|nr:type I asparaginase [Candidatus Avibacteroides excrementipullorum]
MDRKETSVLLIYTGGTIGMIENSKTGALESFNYESMVHHVPELGKLNFNIDTVQFEPPIDSSDMHPAIWCRLASIIAEKYDDYTGFVVLHGTDTMAYTASALSFMLRNLTKPVILTGAQLPIKEIRTDGKENLLTSLEIAAAQIDGKPIVREVCVFFENHLMRGNRTTKINAENFNAFHSCNYPNLAEAGIHIKYENAYMLSPEEGKGMTLQNKYDSNVAILSLFPGIQEAIVKAVLETPGLKGVILKTFGSGNAPHLDFLMKYLKAATDRGIIIVNVTQCLEGMVEMDRYESGRQLLEAGVVCGKDMTIEAALTKLMILLGLNYTTEEIREQMTVSFAGELS